MVHVPGTVCILPVIHAPSLPITETHPHFIFTIHRAENGCSGSSWGAGQVCALHVRSAPLGRQSSPCNTPVLHVFICVLHHSPQGP